MHKRLQLVAKLKQEQQELTEMIRDILENSADFRTAKAAKGEALRDYNLVKAQIINEPETAKLADKLKEIRAELAEERSLLAGELAIYFSKEGRSEVILPTGQVVRFKLSATISEQRD